jgi:hypothetical protein
MLAALGLKSQMCHDLILPKSLVLEGGKYPFCPWPSFHTAYTHLAT